MVQWNTCVQCHMHVCSGEYTGNVQFMYTSVFGHIVDCIGFIPGIQTDIVASYIYINTLAYLAYMRHFRVILLFGTYMTITCFQSHAGDSATKDTITFIMLTWLFRGALWLQLLVLVPVLASVSSAIDDDIGVMWCQCQWHHMTKKVMLHVI